MDNILFELFTGEYDPTPEWDEERRRLGRGILAQLDRVAEVLGVEMAEHLSLLEGERADWRSFRYYQAGFRLGVRLMLEGLGS